MAHAMISLIAWNALKIISKIYVPSIPSIWIVKSSRKAVRPISGLWHFSTKRVQLRSIRDNQYSVNSHHIASLHISLKKKKIQPQYKWNYLHPMSLQIKVTLASFQQLTGKLMATMFIFPELGCPCFLATFSLTVQMTENAESNCVSSRFLRK